MQDNQTPNKKGYGKPLCLAPVDSPEPEKGARTSPPLEQVLEQSRNIKHQIHKYTDELSYLNASLLQEIQERDQLNEELVETLQKLSPLPKHSFKADTALKIAQALLEVSQHAFHDSLTGIPNREVFNKHLEQTVELAHRSEWLLAVMFIDLDRFKVINDTYGHAVGDQVLKIMAKRLRDDMRGGDVLCRYGGDEFLYLAANPKSIENVLVIAQRLIDRVTKRVHLDELVFDVGLSIGIAIYPLDALTSEDLIHRADVAMYRAKRTKAGHAFYDRALDQTIDMV